MMKRKRVKRKIKRRNKQKQKVFKHLTKVLINITLTNIVHLTLDIKYLNRSPNTLNQHLLNKYRHNLK